MIPVATGMDPEESYTNQVSQSRKDNSILSPFCAKWEKAKELIYNTKRDSENSNTKSPSAKKVKARDELEIRD